MPEYPTEVHLVTTMAGRAEAIDGLLDEEGEFRQFTKDHNPKITGAASSAH